MKKLIALILAALLTLSMLTACSGKPVVDETKQAEGEKEQQATDVKTEEKTEVPTEKGSSEKKFRVGLCLSTGGRGDRSFNDQAYDGVTRAVNEFGIEMDLAEPKELAEIEPFLTDFAKSGEYDVIIAVGFSSAEQVKNVAALYPEEKFLLIDSACNDYENVASLTFNKSEEGFLTGVFCAYFASMDSIKINGTDVALKDSKKTIGAILGVESPDILEALAGLYAGLKYVDPEVKAIYGSVGSWSDQNKAAEIAMAMYDQGVNMVWQDAGAAGQGIFTAAADYDLYSLGWNSVQHELDPEHLPCSVIKGVDVAAYEWIKDYLESGTFVSGNKDNNCANGSIYMVYSDAFEIPQEVVDAVEAARVKLANGEIVSPLTLEEVDTFTATQN
jgi:basic membrane protein A